MTNDQLPIPYSLISMSNWLEHSVQVEVEVPIDLAWSLWSDLEQMPRWMKWIDSVQVLEDNPELSRWKLATGSLEFSWLSRILKLVPHQIIQWESVDGLPNRGAVRFYDRHGSSIVKLTVAYAIPGFLGQLMDNLFLGRVVESTIQADLERFRDYALKLKTP
ncbi:MAG TPA: SRPBCC family protein [Coleofasciculaceae cyanobacterium]